MYENGVDGEGEKGKGLLCDEFNEFVQNEVVYVPMTPAKTGQPDSDMTGKNWFESPFDEAIFEEQSMKKSFSCWKGSFGSTSQMYNRFSLDDAETLSMSCQDLLALATKKGSDCGGYGGGAAGLTQQSGRLNMLYDLNLPPEMMADTTVNTGLSLQFTPLTPDQAKRMNLEADKEVVEANQDSEKGLTEQADLNETNETPQPKQKRRKHRPKVVTEGKPKRVRKPATPKPATPNPDGSSTGKRRYVRRNGVEKSATTPDGSSTGKRKYVRRNGVEKSTTPAVDETSGSVHPTPDQQTKKTCKRKIDFDESEKQAEATSPDQQTGKRNIDFDESEKQAEVTVDNSCTVTSGVVEDYEKSHETVSPNPITPSKTELPQAKVKQSYTKAKCKINFLQETHDKVPSHLPSPNESGCSTSVCNKGDEAQRSFDEIKLMNEQIMKMKHDSLESYLSIFTDYSLQSSEHNVKMNRESSESLLSVYANFKRVRNLQSSTINKKKGKAPATPNDSYKPTRGQSSKRKKIMVHDSVSFGGRIDGGYQQQHTYMSASMYHNHSGYNMYYIDALVEHFKQLHINGHTFVRGYHENNALVVYQQDRSVVPYAGVFNPMKKKKQRPKVDLDDETNRVWMLLLENINSEGIDGTDEDKAKWWEEERRVFRGRADSFIARMHLVQGDRRFSQWKGSVLDSVVGVFLTQNVSDHLSSSAFMALAARYPVKRNTSSEPLHEEPCQVDASGDHDPIPMMLQEVDSCEDKEVVNSNEFSKSCIVSVDLNDKSECEVLVSSEKESAIYKESVINHTEADEIVSADKATADGCTSFVELLHMQGHTRVYNEKCASGESEISTDCASQTTVQMVNTISSQESANSYCCMVQQVVEKNNTIVEASGESVQKVVDFHLNKDKSNRKTDGMDEGHSNVKKEKTEKTQIKVDWDKLRFEAEVKQKRERTPNTMDSMDYEAIRAANVNDVADAIKERGMNNRLAARIKDMLDRLVRDHGSIDLEWLRDVPPDKAKEYLLSFKGLGLKSVECIRLLTLHHLAFPVDTNVGRIAVRLGWVPLQALPESLQLHLLELYPVQESIQKYLWPRLCKLDQKTLYELHYQMITFGKVFCTKTKPNCNACPLRGECRHFASAFASARLALPAPEESIAGSTENRTGRNPIGMIDFASTSEQLNQLSEVQICNPVNEQPATLGPIVEVPATPGPTVEVTATPGPIVEMPASPEPEQIQEAFDIEDFIGDNEEIPMIKLNIEEFTQNLQTYMERHMELGEGDMSKALVALTPEAASIPTPKLKNVSQLRTEHQVYELPDSHPLLEGLDIRETDDPCPYLLAIWTPGESADSIQPPEGQCCFYESGTLCNQETCFFCNSTREANAQTVRGTLLIPCRTATRGSFPLNGTYFQVNEVFADHESSLNPIDVPRAWLWNLPKRTVYFGTSIPTIFKGLTTEEIQYCFWRGFVCVRGFDRKERAPRPLRARLHFPASRLKQTKPKTEEKETLKQ
ncbi:putative DNA-(apurinic or apyrimidinic site) lyase [Helianthus debilis subsp. tardiflorus]